MKTKRTRHTVSLKWLRRYLDYNPETGVVKWRLCPKGLPRKYKGQPITTTDTHGYYFVQIKGRTYRLHRIAWALYHGEFPPDDMVVDHINGNRKDNRIKNLRLLTRQENDMNRHKEGKSIGVYDLPNGKWLAIIYVDKKQKRIGVFDTELEALKARAKVELETVGFVNESNQQRIKELEAQESAAPQAVPHIEDLL